MLPGAGEVRTNIAAMPKRVKHSRPFWAPLAENFKSRLTSEESRLRRQVVRYFMWGAGLLFLYSLCFGDYGIPRIMRLHMERENLIEANRLYTVELADAARIRQLLQSDQSYLEYIARTRYRMVRENETIYRYRGQ